MDRPPLPPFTLETALQKARMAEDAGNSRDPARVVLGYAADSRWRNRSELLQGREAIQEILARRWQRELDYRLIKEIWGCRGNRIDVRFAYEWHDAAGQSYRGYGTENWEFDAHGLMRIRIASINDARSATATAGTTGRSAGGPRIIRCSAISATDRPP